MIRRVHILCLLLLVPLAAQAQAPDAWGIFPATVKITSDTQVPDDIPALHAARSEYAPFQVMLRGGVESTSAPRFAYDDTVFEVNTYEQHFLPIQEVDESPPVYSTAWIEADFIADGLRRMGDVLLQNVDGIYGVWVDVYVLPDAPPGDYTITVTVGEESRNVPVTVYPVTMPANGSTSVMVPLSISWAIQEFAAARRMSPQQYHQEVNALLHEHNLTPGTLVGEPVFNGTKWDFSAYTEEINAIPEGNDFYAPVPYNEVTENFIITDETGTRYEQAQFDDPYFVAQLRQFFGDLQAYLQSIGRLDDALLYPTDETFWVADEPDNSGPAGYEQLRLWAQIINETDLRITGSRVLPVPFGEGWPDVTDLVQDSHVATAYLESAPELFSEWSSQPRKSVSIYLNQYGDIVDMSPAVNRGIVWYAYARDVETITGYAALEWVDEGFRLVNPFENPEAVYPQFGYGTGALVYPDPTPSVRLKLLREGVEDARLLDVYAAQTSPAEARAFAACLSPGDIAEQNPPLDLWENAHAALLEAVANNTVVDTSLCLPPPEYDDVRIVIDPETTDMSVWDLSGTLLDIVPSPFDESGEAMRFEFQQGQSSAFYYLGEQNWSGYEVLMLDVQNRSPYFADLDVAVGDDENYLLLMNTSQLIPPDGDITLEIPLEISYGAPVDDINWARITYLDLAAGTEITRRDFQGNINTYDIGGRTLVIDNIRIAR